MTKTEMMEYKRMAKRVAETAGEMKNVKMTQMVLLESGKDADGNVDYVMFRYEGHEYQAWEDVVNGSRNFGEYATEDDNTVQLTEMEQQVMREVPQDDFYDNGLDSVIWSDCFVDGCGIENKKVRGVISSLSKKGMIEVNGTGREATICLTELGKKYLVNNGICDADGWFIKPAKMVTLLAFTGMVIGEFKVIAENAETITIETKQGEMEIDKATKTQVDPKNKKFANRIA